MCDGQSQTVKRANRPQSNVRLQSHALRKRVARETCATSSVVFVDRWSEERNHRNRSNLSVLGSTQSQGATSRAKKRRLTIPRARDAGVDLQPSTPLRSYRGFQRAPKECATAIGSRNGESQMLRAWPVQQLEECCLNIAA
eukprot:2182126-Prymnesium_polylepis.1